jgi:hypothetical protein
MGQLAFCLIVVPILIGCIIGVVLFLLRGGN